MADDKRVLNLVPGLEPDSMSAGVEEFRRKLATMIEHRKLMAKLQHAAYVAYLAEGFTAKQAMDLVKNMDRNM